MPTYRIKKDRDNPYVMANKAFIYDKRLSFKAKGIMIYLMSRPDDWQVYESEIVKHSLDGRRSVSAGIKELIEAGYIHRKQLRDNKNQFSRYEYIVHEIPPTIPPGLQEIDPQLYHYLVAVHFPKSQNVLSVENSGFPDDAPKVVHTLQEFIDGQKSVDSCSGTERHKRIKEIGV